MNARLRPAVANGLNWVRAELDQSLQRARTLIEQHAEAPETPQPLQQAHAELHQVSGTASMIQCFGIAFMAAEMKDGVQALRDGRVADVAPLHAALVSAAVQLADYLDALADGMSDCVLVLQSAVNEIRIACGRPLLTEPDLFAAQMNAMAEPPALIISDSSEAQIQARKLLPAFQASLLPWLKSAPEAATALARIGKIAEQIAASAVQPPLQLLWRSVAACVEALLGHALEETLDLKRLFGAAGQQLKSLGEGGEAEAATRQGDLAWQLLFFVGRSRGQGPRVGALRKAHQLSVHLPSAGQVDELRRRIHGPGAALLARVADEIRTDFSQIKDAIDLAVRTGVNQELGETLARMKRVADTLAMLGLLVLQRVMMNQVRVLDGASGTVSSELWMDVATALLRVEHSLDAALFAQLRARQDSAEEYEERIPHAADLREGVNALLRESLVNLARFKSAIAPAMQEPGIASSPEALRLLGEVAAVFRILDRERAARLVSQLERYLRAPEFASAASTEGRMERFADAIICLEYHIEAVRDQLPQAESLLDNLAACVEQLEVGDVDELALPSAAESFAPVVAPEVEPLPELPASPPTTPEESGVDPEILAVFLEEAAEVQGQIEALLPRWIHNLQDREALSSLRRGFHTLKGSGRMVGATDIGEFGWAVESLLNRCLDGTVAIAPPVVEFLREAVALLPELIAAFRDHTATPEALAAVCARAQSLAESRAAASDEPDLLVIFREDADEKFSQIESWLQALPPEQENVDADAEVIRAIHTLRGSAQVVGLEALSRVAEALEVWLDALRGAELRMDRSGVTLIADALAQFRAWAAAPESGDEPVQDLLTRIGAQRAKVPETAVQAVSDRQLAEVFAGEAFELTQQIEQLASEWAHTPDNLQPPRQIQALAHTLMGAAQMSACAPIAAVARALHARMQAMGADSGLPQPSFFTAFSQICEGIYQQLDALREGSLRGDGSELVARIGALEVSAAPADVPVEAAVALDAGAETAFEIPPVIPQPHSQPESTSDAVAELIELRESPAEFETEADEEPLQVSTLSTEDDAELLSIFLAEAGELLEVLDSACSSWERAPADATAPADIRRALHTLKGSARMAGLAALGDAAQRMEHWFEGEAVKPSPAFFARLHALSDALLRVIDDVRQGRSADVATLLAEIEAPLPVSRPTYVEPLQFLPQPVTPAQPQGMAAPQPQLDDDLADIFAGEAAELLQSLDQSLQAWMAAPYQTALARDMQRALHTLKGGARMAGLNTMGDVAHEMEERVNPLEDGSRAADATAFAELQAMLEQIQLLHDGISQAAAPASPAVPAAAVTAETPLTDSGWDPRLFWRPEDDDAGLMALRRETARVPVENLDGMLNQAGEISIYRSRLEEENSAIQAQLNEMVQAITRVREQLRQLDAETDAQISARGLGSATAEGQDRYADFDPLEMDRYTRMQELSRALNESVGDLSNLHATMDELASSAETLLLQQGRINTEIQQGLMGTLMVPFSRQVARLQRVVRQVAAENGKLAEAQFEGIESELDRNVLERMTAPLEHLLRNAVVHGLEVPEARRAAGKPEQGRVSVSLRREGTQLLIELRDDGRGLDFEAIRRTAVQRGLMPEDAELADSEVAQFIFQPGFSTARTLTQDAGRGIGMDVVASEVKQLGGTLEIASETGRGARFLIRLPLTLAISQALLVGLGEELFAVPLPSIEGIARVPRDRLEAFYSEGGPAFSYGGQDYRVRYLGDFTGSERRTEGEGKTVSAILVRVGEGLGASERRIAVVVDELLGNREIVSKTVGPLVSSISGIAGASILADGRVVLILDVAALALDRTRRALVHRAVGKLDAQASGADVREHIMVVDDSVTIRRVTERLLAKHGFRVTTAKDGLDAMAQLQTEQPAAILLDIEMPRADGFEVAAFVRNTTRIARTPIIMITSRSGDKHRERALRIGVNRYLIKPYLEDQLLGEIRGVLNEVRA